MKLLKFCLIALTAASLSACGDDDIDKVKNYKPNGNATISEVMDSWKICESTEWAKRPGVNGTFVITYTCNLADVKNHANAVMGIILKNKIDNRHETVTEEFKSSLKKLTDFKGIQLNVLFELNKMGHVIPYEATSVYTWNDGVTGFAYSSWRAFIKEAKLNERTYFQMQHGNPEDAMAIAMAAVHEKTLLEQVRTSQQKKQLTCYTGEGEIKNTVLLNVQLLAERLKG